MYLNTIIFKCCLTLYTPRACHIGPLQSILNGLFEFKSLKNIWFDYKLSRDFAAFQLLF